MSNKEFMEDIFSYDKLLTSRKRKDFIEYMSLESLKCCFDNKYNDFFVADSPDIQNKSGIVGVEVTEAISREEAQINGEFVKYHIKGDRKRKERSKAIIEANGGRLDEICLTYPIKNIQNEKSIFQDAIRKKMRKLESYRKKGFQTIELLIYYDELPIPFGLEDIKLWFDEVLNDYEDKYNSIYLLHPYRIINYDIMCNDIQTTIIEREKYELLKDNVRVLLEEKYSKY